MFEAGSIEGRIGLDESPALRSLKNTENAVRDFKQQAVSQMSQAGKSSVGSFQKSFNELKSNFGRSSLFSQAARTVQGGGALLGFSMVGDQARNLTDGLVQLKNAAISGKMGVGEVIEKFGSGIPVMGGFFQAGLNINEMFTGQKAEAAAAIAANDAYIQDLKEHKEILSELRIAEDRHTEATRHMREEMALVGKSGLAKEMQEIANATADATAEAWKGTGVRSLTKDQLADLEAQKKIIKEINDTKPNMDSIVAQLRQQHDSWSDERVAKHASIRYQRQSNAFDSVGLDRAILKVADYTKLIEKSSNDAFSESMLARAKGLLQDVDAIKVSVTDWAKTGLENIGEKLRKATEDVSALRHENALRGLDKYDQLTQKNTWKHPGDRDEQNAYKLEVEDSRHLDAMDSIKEIQKQIDQISMDPFRKQLDDLRRDGKSSSDLQTANAKLHQLEDATNAKALRDGLITPFMKFKKEMAELDHLHGLRVNDPGHISDLDYKARKAQIRDEFGANRSPDLIRSGSQESLRLQAQAKNRSVGDRENKNARNPPTSGELLIVGTLKEIKQSILSVASVPTADIPGLS